MMIRHSSVLNAKPVYVWKQMRALILALHSEPWLFWMMRSATPVEAWNESKHLKQKNRNPLILIANLVMRIE